MKIDFTQKIAHNSLYINKYNSLVKKEKIGSFFLIPICYFFGIYMYAELHANVISWSFLACVLLGTTILAYFHYKKIYENNIASIQKSLEELKELEDE